MKINGIKNISNTINLLDKHIYNLLKKVDFKESRLNTLTRVRTEYIEELNNQIRIENTKKMFK